MQSTDAPVTAAGHPIDVAVRIRTDKQARRTEMADDMINDCSVPEHQGSVALFELTTFLAGRTRAWGIFEDRFGTMRRRFTVAMNGHWQEQIFLLDETFVYDSGESETRTWRVVPIQHGRFTATCADCIGSASGVCDADSIRMHYKFRLRMNTRSLIVDFDDRIYRMGNGVAVNRATLRKWGVKIGELSLFFERLDADAAPAGPRAAA